jgi:hypothetical protein
LQLTKDTVLYFLISNYTKQALIIKGPQKLRPLYDFKLFLY